MAYQRQVVGQPSPPNMGYPAQLSLQPSPQVLFATPPALPPAPSGYQYQLVPVASPHQSFSAPPPVPTASQATPAPTTLDYPYILTGKHQMTLFTPDRSQALFIVNYPDTWSWSWSKSRNMTMLRASSGERLANAEFHSFTTSKVDAYYRGNVYHFKERFVSRTGLGSEAGFFEDGVMMLWDVWNGEMTLGRDDGRGGIVARFVPRGDAAGLGGHTNTLEGRLELRMLGLIDTQFEEIFVTLVADMERRRRTNEEWAVAAAVV